MPRTEAASPPEPPRDEEIRERLGPAFALYRAFVESGPFTPQWKYYGPKYGWSLKLFEKKRNLCFLGPQDGVLDVSFVLGDRAREAGLAGPGAEDVAGLLRDARHYPEGWGVKVSVRDEAGLALALRLLAIKRAS